MRASLASPVHDINSVISPKEPKITKRLILISMLFVSFLIVSNLTAYKIVEIHPKKYFSLDFPAALVFFPLTYFFDDVLTEVYGFKISRLIIWGGLVCTVFVTLCTWVAVNLPASPVWDVNTHHGSGAYEAVFKGSVRVFFASVIAYFFGEFSNSIILSKLKVLTKGKYFSFRVLASTITGAGIDSSIFCSIAFWRIMPHPVIWKMVLTLSIFKVSYEFAMLPITFLLTSHLKAKDKIDCYDRNTKFSPFSLSLKD